MLRRFSDWLLAERRAALAEADELMESYGNETIPLPVN
jgi:hypothetical protein